MTRTHSSSTTSGEGSQRVLLAEIGDPLSTDAYRRTCRLFAMRLLGHRESLNMDFERQFLSSLKAESRLALARSLAQCL